MKDTNQFFFLEKRIVLQFSISNSINVKLKKNFIKVNVYS